MEYQALYRRYRPNTFEGVIGQRHITEILKNQIETGHTSHAYLFSGTRGTGKTSTAKILARAVNCLSPINGEPCNECEACKILPEANVDVIELDAASNNGVDDMRALIEKAVFAPVKLKKKVYIIDEAHMLSGAAFNALLKTLEEPPSHVMFILATTEPHKIIPTITSRCQRFDFRRLRSADIIDCVASVVEKAGAHIDSEGLMTIAKKANGGMRDALSLADQCISFCGGNVTSKDVYDILGSSDFDGIFNLAENLCANDAKQALLYFDSVISGRDISVVLQDLASHFRSLMLIKMCGSCADILDCTDEDMRKLEKQANETSKERIMRALDILSTTQTELKYYPQPRFLVETAFVKICSPETEMDITAVLDRINVLEKQIKETPAQIVYKTEEPTKPTVEQKKKKRVVSDDAKKVYNDLCNAFKEKGGSFGMFVAASLLRAIDVKVNNKEFVLYFTEQTHFDTIKTNKEKIDVMLGEKGYELELRPVLEQPDDSDNIEETLAQQFGNIKFTE